MTTSSRLRAAVVGADPVGFGGRAHLPAIQASRYLDLVGVCTAHDDTARAAASRFDVPRWYASVDALAAEADIDLVTIAVRPSLHRELTEPLLRAGKMVYCEWPLAARTSDAALMDRIAREEGIPNAVGLQGRFVPAIQEMRRAVRSGAIGQPHSFEASLLQAPFAVHSDRAWLARRSEASGALYVAAAHVTDAVQYVLGDLDALVSHTRTVNPEGLFADTGGVFRWETEDTVIYLAQLVDGTTGTVTVSNAVDPPAGFNFSVIGDEGQLTASASQYFQFSPVKLTIARPGGYPEVVDVDPGDGRDEDSPATNVSRALDAFALAAIDGEVFSPSFTDGLRLHRLVDAVEASSARRTWLHGAEDWSAKSATV